MSRAGAVAVAAAVLAGGVELADAGDRLPVAGATAALAPALVVVALRFRVPAALVTAAVLVVAAESAAIAGSGGGVHALVPVIGALLIVMTESGYAELGTPLAARVLPRRPAAHLAAVAAVAGGTVAGGELLAVVASPAGGATPALIAGAGIAAVGVVVVLERLLADRAAG